MLFPGLRGTKYEFVLTEVLILKPSTIGSFSFVLINNNLDALVLYETHCPEIRSSMQCEIFVQIDKFRSINYKLSYIKI